MLRTSIANRHFFRKYCTNVMSKARDKLRTLGDGNISVELNNDTRIATITIDQENKKNAISGKMMVDLESTLNELENWTNGKAILLQGNGDFFCSGADLTTVKNIVNQEDGSLMCVFMQNVTSRLAKLPLVSFSLVHGGALGGGAELATCTDFRIFTDKSAIAFLAAKMGLSTGWGGGTRLTKLIGPRLALNVLLSARKINHDEAMTLGLADFTINSENRIMNAMELISNMVKHDRDVLFAAKNLVLGATSLSREEESMDHERKIFLSLLGGPANLRSLKQGIKHR